MKNSSSTRTRLSNTLTLLRAYDADPVALVNLILEAAKNAPDGDQRTVADLFPEFQF
jgi:hypothetical protein